MHAERKSLYIPALELERVTTPDFSAARIGRETHTILTLYYRGALRDETALHYLQETTIPHIDDALQGLYMNCHAMQKLPDDEIPRMITEGRELLLDPTTQSAEAFHHAMTVFSFMPELCDLRVGDMRLPFSRIQTIQPPRRLSDARYRLWELKAQLEQIATGKRYAYYHQTDAELRTQAFFLTANELALRMPEKETIQAATERLLADIEIDL